MAPRNLGQAAPQALPLDPSKPELGSYPPGVTLADLCPAGRAAWAQALARQWLASRGVDNPAPTIVQHLNPNPQETR